MKGKVNCTCGWSWNKSDSSVKDMYICHQCGRDNSNNMKNGGWLDNYNDSQASAPEGMVGDGFSNVGRNYSPAWGGQFQEGGEIPKAQGGKATRADSLDVYNRALKIDAYYDNLKKKGWYPKRDIYPTRNMTSKQLEEEMKKVDKESRETYKKQSKIPKGSSILNYTYPNADPKKANLKALADHIALTKGTRYASQDNLPSIIDPMAPQTVIDTRIIPKETVHYETIEGVKADEFYKKYPNPTEAQRKKFYKEMEKYEKSMPPSGTAVNLYRYDPLSVKPWDMLTDAEKKVRVEKYGTDGVPKSYIDKLKPEDKQNKEDKIDKQRPKVEALQPLTQQGAVSDFSIDAQLPVIRPEARMPKSFDVNSQRQTMSGPSEYYNYSDEGVDFSDALRAKESANTYNQYVQEKYKEAAKSNPKAQKRLEQLMQNVELTPNYQMGGNVYPVNYVPQAAMGASMPGSVGFTYARTKGIPSNGPYAKKTMASAKNGGWLDAYKEGGIIRDDRGQWNHPGEITRISGGKITMKKDPKTGKALTEPLLGIADTGEQQWMYPGEDYNFEGANYVTEIPKRKLAKNGLRQEQKGLQNLDNLLNFTNYNKPQPGGWLDSYK